jgi:hypothetical protein
MTHCIIKPSQYFSFVVAVAVIAVSFGITTTDPHAITYKV